jgi:hypothetical protein
MNMKHDQLHDELVDLGAASVETKGGAVGIIDTEATLYRRPGLSDD